MADDPFDDPALKAYLIHAQTDLIPKMRDSKLCMTIVGEPDAKLCMEVGAMVMLDKPVIVIVPPGQQVPSNLKRCAAAIIEGDMNAPGAYEKLRDAIKQVTQNDQRAH